MGEQRQILLSQLLVGLLIFLLSFWSYYLPPPFPDFQENYSHLITVCADNVNGSRNVPGPISLATLENAKNVYGYVTVTVRSLPWLTQPSLGTVAVVGSGLGDVKVTVGPLV